ncbi:hypothetical protein AQUCO_01000124v1 [Aquilegia coerulea]|uniref:Protein root UVB sensitive/RUS domain-containing protein n=1 Tax=Aquilegia coerulea TaxID=218851 RepID=A0A2G5E8J1_AQUCA|nr:hypothetical protein AQUCO_01000124v1 [Aquilegia coerulea]
MFRAMGVGFSRSLPSAAALNWVLKDGLGRLSRFIYTASLASTFDTKLKRIRFSTSIVFSLSIGVELLTPFFPHYFLLIATVANIAKQLSLACYLATNSAVHRSFAVADNLCELSAKSQIQTVCFDNLGLMLAALLNIPCKNNQSLQAGLALLLYPIFSTIDLFGIYQGLKHVHLQTLTKDRLEIILDAWIQSKVIPSPEDVSKEEGIDLPWCKGTRLWPIRIGCFDSKDTVPKFSMLTMRSLRNEDSYFICLETTNRGFARRLQGGILLSLRDRAGTTVGSTEGTAAVTTDIVMGLLQACYIRRELLLSMEKWELVLEDDNISEPVLKEWFQLVEDSKRNAELEVKMVDEEISRYGWAKENILLSEQKKAQPLEKKIQEAGWAVDNILLDDQEKICYSFLDVTKKGT